MEEYSAGVVKEKREALNDLSWKDCQDILIQKQDAKQHVSFVTSGVKKGTIRFYIHTCFIGLDHMKFPFLKIKIIEYWQFHMAPYNAHEGSIR